MTETKKSAQSATTPPTTNRPDALNQTPTHPNGAEGGTAPAVGPKKSRRVKMTDYYTINEIAAHCGVTPGRIRQFASNGRDGRNVKPDYTIGTTRLYHRRTANKLLTHGASPLR